MQTENCANTNIFLRKKKWSSPLYYPSPNSMLRSNTTFTHTHAHAIRSTIVTKAKKRVGCLMKHNRSNTLNTLRTTNSNLYLDRHKNNFRKGSAMLTILCLTNFHLQDGPLPSRDCQYELVRLLWDQHDSFKLHINVVTL